MGGVLTGTGQTGHARDLREVLAELPTGVTVLSAMTPDGPVGMTSSAVTSLSLDPMLMLACVHRSSSTLALILEAGRFGISVLGSDAAAVSEAFAQGPPLDRFRRVPYRTERGVPLLRDALAGLTCEVFDTHPGGDHTILVGRVTGAARADGAAGTPLVRHRGSYRGLG
ncbi:MULTISPECIES: flavin reductase family protein [Streptomyces]|uniref:flavin reductase family protein n=1 Tax=Streptomyces TaxID=1883 RepID=UPI00207A4E4B|nr:MULTISPECIES: flavin reductase family protein [Streptomyces]MCM9076584.1 flavin reductase family protein [Streptomyces spororaveus]MCX5308758.1 flavin reductase family protein [Streptomyces sp. NBC_00160]